MRVGYVSILSVLVLGCVGLSACTTSSSDDESSAADLSAPGHELTLADVQLALKARSGASWTAGETTVSRLPHDARVAMLGVPLSDIPQEQMFVEEDSTLERAATAALPATYDWRNIDGKNFVSPMLDQGRCGSCVAFAAVGTFETQLNIAAQDTSSPWQLSPQFLFACGGGACGSGWYPSSAARYLTTKGVTDNACMPYTSGAHGDDAQCRSACSDSASRTIKARSTTSPTSGGANVTAVKRALQNGPLIASMTVYDDFMYYTGGVYRHVTGGVAGGHALSIVGWSDADKAWIVRNSWGTGWGMSGFFEIAWDDVSGLGSETYGLEAQPQGPYVNLSGIRDGIVLAGQHPLSFDTQSVGGSSASWTLTSGTNMVAQGSAPNGASMINTTSISDGVYTLQPHALNGAARVDGPPHLVYILNGAETGAIKFKTLTPGQTLSGIATWDITVAAHPVPATHVEWTITNAAGEVIVNRTSGNPGALMQLGWNTKNRPNGTYTISVTGGAGSQTLQPATISVNVRN